MRGREIENIEGRREVEEESEKEGIEGDRRRKNHTVEHTYRLLCAKWWS